MIYYFAYGPNMLHEQMEKRCPGNQFVKAVCLQNYQFVYDGYSKKWKGSVANIIKSPSDIVWGAVRIWGKDFFMRTLVKVADISALGILKTDGRVVPREELTIRSTQCEADIFRTQTIL